MAEIVAEFQKTLHATLELVAEKLRSGEYAWAELTDHQPGMLTLRVGPSLCWFREAYSLSQRAGFIQYGYWRRDPRGIRVPVPVAEWKIDYDSRYEEALRRPDGMRHIYDAIRTIADHIAQDAPGDRWVEGVLTFDNARATNSNHND